MFVYIEVKHKFITICKLDQPACLMEWVAIGQKLYLDKCPVYGEYNATSPYSIACLTHEHEID